jgi:RNA polymerase sigma-70 factor (ECF subfamily)
VAKLITKTALPDNIPYNENNILQQVAAGDDQAFRQLFHHHWDNIYGVAFMFVKHAEQAEELVQDIFLKIWNKKENLAAVVDFKNYLFIIARNHIFSELRKKSKEQAFTEQLIHYFTDNSGNPEQQLLDKESQELLRQAIVQLPEQQRTVYQLVREQGLTHEETAARLQISKNTVRNHMARALEGIRKSLEAFIFFL